MNDTVRFLQRTVVVVGNTVTLAGCLGLMLGWFGIIELEHYAIGLSSGIRVIGAVAIAGCLLSAVGYGILDFQERKDTKG